mmetsp:Transcript_12779/g.25926  ORF Transcript_12779/g.25926 Transcript_12779/m.25926 type:complete len:98 (+) Transcript_12779:197-490(+)
MEILVMSSEICPLRKSTTTNSTGVRPYSLMNRNNVFLQSCLSTEALLTCWTIKGSGTFMNRLIVSKTVSPLLESSVTGPTGKFSLVKVNGLDVSTKI